MVLQQFRPFTLFPSNKNSGLSREKSYETKWWRLIWAVEEQVFFLRFQRKFSNEMLKITHKPKVTYQQINVSIQLQWNKLSHDFQSLLCNKNFCFLSVSFLDSNPLYKILTTLLQNLSENPLCSSFKRNPRCRFITQVKEQPVEGEYVIFPFG